MIRRRRTTRLAIALCAGATLCALSACSRFQAERACCAHDHVEVRAERTHSVADVPIDP